MAVGSDMDKAIRLVVGGWQLSGIYTYRGGQVLQFGCMIAPSSVTQIGGTGKSNYWFDVTGFNRLVAFTWRASPRYHEDLRGPTFQNANAIISKKFKIFERITPEFRLQVFNALSKLNWANPTVSITASDFDRTNAPAAGNVGRQFRYALRVEF